MTPIAQAKPQKHRLIRPSTSIIRQAICCSESLLRDTPGPRGDPAFRYRTTLSHHNARQLLTGSTCKYCECMQYYVPLLP